MSRLASIFAVVVFLLMGILMVEGFHEWGGNQVLDPRIQESSRLDVMEDLQGERDIRRQAGLIADASIDSVRTSEGGASEQRQVLDGESGVGNWHLVGQIQVGVNRSGGSLLLLCERTTSNGERISLDVRAEASDFAGFAVELPHGLSVVLVVVSPRNSGVRIPIYDNLPKEPRGAESRLVEWNAVVEPLALVVGQVVELETKRPLEDVRVVARLDHPYKPSVVVGEQMTSALGAFELAIPSMRELQLVVAPMMSSGQGGEERLIECGGSLVTRQGVPSGYPAHVYRYDTDKMQNCMWAVDGPSRISAGAGERHDLGPVSLAMLERVVISLIDGETGQMVAGACPIVEGAMRGVHILVGPTDENGEASCLVLPGLRTLRGYGEHSGRTIEGEQKVEIVRGGGGVLRCRLTTGQRVGERAMSEETGVIVSCRDACERPVADAVVNWNGSNQTTNEQGLAFFAGLSQESVGVLTITHARFLEKVIPMEDFGKIRRLPVVLDSIDALEVEIVGSRGGSVPELWVQGLARRGLSDYELRAPRARQMWSENSRFLLPRAEYANERWWLVIERNKGLAVFAEPGGGVTGAPLKVTLDGLDRVRGIILGQSGIPIHGAVVCSSRSDLPWTRKEYPVRMLGEGLVDTTTSGSDGRFEIDCPSVEGVLYVCGADGMQEYIRYSGGDLEVRIVLGPPPVVRVAWKRDREGVSSLVMRFKSGDGEAQYRRQNRSYYRPKIVTGAEGVTEFKVFARGVYELIAIHANGQERPLRELDLSSPGQGRLECTISF